MRLFFIGFPARGRCANLDAIVEAASPADAQQLWAEHCGHDLTAKGQQPSIYEINPTGQPGVLGWNTMHLNRII